jgi:Protein of unknown function (DUF2510)
MNEQLAAVLSITTGIGLGAVWVVSWIVGFIDMFRLPGWAWQRANQNRTLWIILLIVLGPIALIFYVFGPRPKVAPIAGGGKAATFQFDGMQGGGQPGPSRAQGSASPPVGYSPFGAASPPVGYGTTGATSPPRGSDGRVYQQPVTVSQTFRPSQPEPPVVTPQPQPSVPAGWKADPVGRHQFRYWDGFKWTDNVADGGAQSTDPV